MASTSSGSIAVSPNLSFGIPVPAVVGGEREGDQYVRTADGLFSGAYVSTYTFDKDSGTWVLTSGAAPVLPTTNTLVNSGVNTMTSTVNGVADSDPIINTVVSTITANSLVTTVNGVASSGTNVVATNVLEASGDKITSTVNGIVADYTPAVGTIDHVVGFNAAGDLIKQDIDSLTTNTLVATAETIVSTVNGVDDTITPLAGTVVNYLGFDVAGDLVKSVLPQEILVGDTSPTIGTVAPDGVKLFFNDVNNKVTRGVDSSGLWVAISEKEVIVTFDTADPNTIGTIFNPAVDIQDVDVVYVSDVDNSFWIWDGLAYVTAPIKSYKEVAFATIALYVASIPVDLEGSIIKLTSGATYVLRTGGNPTVALDWLALDPSAVTADNGLTKIGNNIELGGTLVQATNIAGANQLLSITDTQQAIITASGAGALGEFRVNPLSSHLRWSRGGEAGGFETDDDGFAAYAEMAVLTDNLNTSSITQYNKVTVNGDGINLTLDTDSNLKINGLTGFFGQVLTANGATPPTWKNIAKTVQQLNATGNVTAWSSIVEIGATPLIANITITLPSISTLNVGKEIILKRLDNTAFTVTIIPSPFGNTTEITTPTVLNTQFGALSITAVTVTKSEQTSNIGVSSTTTNTLTGNLASGIVSTVNGTASTLSPVDGTVLKSLGFDATGAIVKQQLTFDSTVDFSVNADPNTVGTTFAPNTPALTTVIYASTIDNSFWVWNGATYVTATIPVYKNVAFATMALYVATLPVDKAGSIVKLTTGSAFILRTGGNPTIEADWLALSVAGGTNDFWRSGATSAVFPDGTADLTDSITHQGRVGLGRVAGNPQTTGVDVYIGGSHALAASGITNQGANITIPVARIDDYSVLFIAQNTAGITLTIPNPTLTTTIVRPFTIVNQSNATAALTINNGLGGLTVLDIGESATWYWTNTGWSKPPNASVLNTAINTTSTTTVNMSGAIINVSGTITITLAALTNKSVTTFVQTGAGTITFAGGLHVGGLTRIAGLNGVVRVTSTAGQFYLSGDVS